MSPGWFYLHSLAATRWPCPGCKVQLGFDLKRRFFSPASNLIPFLVIVAFIVFGHLSAWWLLIAPVTLASKNSDVSLTMVVGEKPFSSAAE